jgi:hypothetical protein
MFSETPNYWADYLIKEIDFEALRAEYLLKSFKINISDSPNSQSITRTEFSQYYSDQTSVYFEENKNKVYSFLIPPLQIFEEIELITKTFSIVDLSDSIKLDSSFPSVTHKSIETDAIQYNNITQHMKA